MTPSTRSRSHNKTHSPSIIGRTSSEEDYRVNADAYTTADREWVGAYYYEWNRLKQLFTWAPSKTWVGSNITGNYTNTNSIGSRSLGTSERYLRTNSNNITILLIGGSFVFGEGVPDNETIAAHLRNTLLGGHVSADVVNAGQIGYHSRQQLNHILDYFTNEVAVDVIVVIDGINDVTAPLTHEIIGGAYGDEDRRKIFNQLTKSRDFRFVHHDRKRPSSVNSHQPYTYAEITSHASLYPGIAKFYDQNSRILDEVCLQRGIQLLHYLQPCLLHKPFKSNYEAQLLPGIIKMQPAIMKTYRMIKTPSVSHKLIEKVGSWSQASFVDWAHLSPSASKIVAEYIAEDIHA